jgi:hypothetical protein
MVAVYNGSYAPRAADAPVSDDNPLFGLLKRPPDGRLMHLLNEEDSGGLIVVGGGDAAAEDKAWLARICEEIAPWVTVSPIQEMESLEIRLAEVLGDGLPPQGEGQAASPAEGEPAADAPWPILPPGADWGAAWNAFSPANREPVSPAEGAPLLPDEGKTRYGGARKANTRPDSP